MQPGGARPGGPASAPIACDLERVDGASPRPWRELLGEEGFTLAQLISQEAGESLQVAATRIWSARECIKKAGLPVPFRLTLLRQEGPMVWLHTHSAPVRDAGRSITIATWVLATQEIADPLVIAILAGAAPVGSPSACTGSLRVF